MSQQYEHIMVAIDGSHESELAFLKGVHLSTFSVTQKLTCSLFVILKKRYSHLSQAPTVLFSYNKL